MNKSTRFYLQDHLRAFLLTESTTFCGKEDEVVPIDSIRKVTKWLIKARSQKNQIQIPKAVPSTAGITLSVCLSVL